jgi:hypothetical protein
MDRRNFLKAGSGAIAASPALMAQQSGSANDRLGIAVIGVGTRGIYLLERVQEAPNVEIRAICDLYDSNLQRALKTSFNKKAELTKDWEKAIASKDIDAVVIATPDFWHAPMTIRAAQLKKHVYVEKGLCRTLQEAKDIRKAVRDNKITLQLGHHQNSDPPSSKRARSIRAAAGQNAPGPHLHRSHQRVARMAVLHALRQSGPAARREPAVHRLGAVPGGVERADQLRCRSVSSAGAAGGSTARASPAT